MRIYNLTSGLGQLQTRSARNPPPQKTSTRPSVSDRYIIFNRTKTVFQIYSELIHYGFIEISIADWRWDQIDWPLNCLPSDSTLSCRWTTYYQCTMVHGWACTVVGLLVICLTFLLLGSTCARQDAVFLRNEYMPHFTWLKFSEEDKS